MQEFLDSIKKYMTDNQILLNEPLYKHTTFGVGGIADFVLLPNSIEQIEKCILNCKKFKIKFYILGNGSNVLVSDKGFKGVIIKLLDNFSNIEFNNNLVKVQAGARLITVSKKCMENGLCGFEFASGIPGTFGGGICMNAGAFGGELKDVVKSVTVLKNDKIITLNNEECGFEYRNSKIFKENLIVLEVCIKLNNSTQEKIKEKMENIKKERTAKQPYEYKSAGSTFKRPTNNFAGKLIMDAGLKGYNVGGAYVSEKHCGFIINKNGDATCDDVLKLIDIIYKVVFDKFNIKLEKEVKVIGEF